VSKQGTCDVTSAPLSVGLKTPHRYPSGGSARIDWTRCLDWLSLTTCHVKALRPRFGPLFLDGTFRPRVSPRRDSLNYYLQASERVFDVALYTLSLRFEKFL
jgi:hypothetical protein